MNYKLNEIINVRFQTLIVFCFIPILLCIVNATASSINTYQPVVNLNGERYNKPYFNCSFKSLSGKPDHIQVGDVIEILGFHLVLRKIDTLNFYWDKETPYILSLKNENEDIKPVAIAFSEKNYNDLCLSSNKYKGKIDLLSSESLQNMWGIRFDSYLNQMSNLINNVIPESTFIMFYRESLSKKNKNSLNSSINNSLAYANYISINRSANHGIKDFSFLSKAFKLKYLHISYIDDFNLSFIKPCNELKHLEISGWKIKELDVLNSFKNLKSLNLRISNDTVDLNNFSKCSKISYLKLLLYSGRKLQTIINWDSISNLKMLEYLDLSLTKSLSDISFIKKLNNLKVLKLSHCSVTDLSPIAHTPKLIYVNSSCCPIKTLPNKQISNKCNLVALSTKLSNREIKKFKTKNPNCKFNHEYKSSLTSYIKDANYLEIRNPPFKLKDSITLYIDSTGNEIQPFLNLVKIAKKKSDGRRCLCRGGPWIYFYKDDELKHVLSIQHGKAIRSHNSSWPNDARLTLSSRILLKKWLKRLIKN